MEKKEISGIVEKYAAGELTVVATKQLRQQDYTLRCSKIQK